MRTIKRDPDWSTIGFILGLLILGIMLYLALVTPHLINLLFNAILSIDIPTKFQIDGKMYDTKNMTLDLFRNLTLAPP